MKEAAEEQDEVFTRDDGSSDLRGVVALTR